MVRLVRLERSHTLAATSLAIAALLSSGCGEPRPTQRIAFVAIPTSDQTADAAGACRLALMSGRLVLHEEAGLAVQGSPPSTAEVVVWPKGFAAADAHGVRFLLDDMGRRIARVGDQVQAGGGLGAGDRFHVCGEVTVTDEPP